METLAETTGWSQVLNQSDSKNIQLWFKEVIQWGPVPPQATLMSAPAFLTLLLFLMEKAQKRQSGVCIQLIVLYQNFASIIIIIPLSHSCYVCWVLYADFPSTFKSLNGFNLKKSSAMTNFLGPCHSKWVSRRIINTGSFRHVTSSLSMQAHDSV